MRVIGIDPGTLNTGYGILDENQGRLTAVAFGTVKLSSKVAIEQRLFSLYTELNKIFDLYNPDEVALEEPFVAGNVKSAFAIGRAQAMAILIAVMRNLPVFRYLPNQIKQQVTNYGMSTKEQVAEMVKVHLGIREEFDSEDASDALATAICHISQSHLERLIKNGL
jgi:crossover junction endodeoxyribonuclease RuvC